MNGSGAEKPFFAKYLEGQDFPKVKTSIKGGEEIPQTLKYPSDTDEVSTRPK
jgi:hypothetical protein